MKKILVLSPHMDDAVLSCSDYLVKKQKKGNQILVITIFTKFKVKNLVNDAKRYLVKSGYKNINKFQNDRKKEDISSLNYLGFDYDHWDFIDGGFRQSNGKNTYKNYKSLFSGKIHSMDKKIIIKIKERLSQYQNKHDEIIIPLGIGNHADHLIVKKCAERIFPNKKINYYVDWPYAYKLHNWNLKKIIKVFRNLKYLSFTSKTKKEALNFYKSQIQMLFGRKPIFYPEIVSQYEIQK